MRFKNKKFIFALVSVLAIFLAGCSNSSQTSKKTNTLPSAKTILTKAEKDTYKSMHATWTEADSTKTLQKAAVQYTTNPTVVYADVAATSNHYKMWIEGKTSYIQMKGTSSSRWFKTKSKDNDNYSSLIKSLNGSLLAPFVSLGKQFKVKQAGNGYVLQYKGNNKKIWNAIISDSGVTSLIGIDIDDVKPIESDIQIKVDSNYHMTGVKIASTYKDDGEKKKFTMTVDQIGQVKKLSIPASVKKNAVDLGKLGQK